MSTAILRATPPTTPADTANAPVATAWTEFDSRQAELPSPAAPRPTVLDWIAATTAMIALVAVGLMRINCGDIAWHLATARLAAETGHWPVTNTFSHTWPGYTLYQQYPLFQSIVYCIYQAAGWDGLSVLLCGIWATALLTCVTWAGGTRRAAMHALPWMIVILAIQRRVMLRPEAISLICLPAMLWVIDRYLRGRRLWIALLPLIQLAWVNSHQLFPLGLAVQVLLLGHIALARWGVGGVSITDRHAALTPVAIALAVSIVLTACTPLGVSMFDIFLRTSDTLSAHRDHIRELAPIWTKPIEAALTVPCAIYGGLALWRQRRAWRPLDIGLWLMSLAMVASANRGLIFFAFVSVGLYMRSFAPPVAMGRHKERERRFIALGDRFPILRPAAACVSLLLSGVVIHQRWIDPPVILGGTQPGLGRTTGDWPDAAIGFLNRVPPPGRMLNLPWSAGNAVIWGLPHTPTFVDPRFESYPRMFMQDCVAASRRDCVLDRLIRDHDITWVFAEHRVDGVLDRVVHLLRTDDWDVVSADSQTIVLVRRLFTTQPYRDAVRPQGPASWTVVGQDPADLLINGPAALRVPQRLAYARLLSVLGQDTVARCQLERARCEAADQPKLAALVQKAASPHAATTQPASTLASGAMASGRNSAAPSDTIGPDAARRPDR